MAEYVNGIEKERVISNERKHKKCKSPYSMMRVNSAIIGEERYLVPPQMILWQCSDPTNSFYAVEFGGKLEELNEVELLEFLGRIKAATEELTTVRVPYMQMPKWKLYPKNPPRWWAKFLEDRGLRPIAVKEKKDRLKEWKEEEEE